MSLEYALNTFYYQRDTKMQLQFHFRKIKEKLRSNTVKFYFFVTIKQIVAVNAFITP